MAEKPNSEEPSIEEILGSIRRIIAEDEDPGRSEEDGEDEEPLELTNRIEPDGAIATADVDEPRDFVVEPEQEAKAEVVETIAAPDKTMPQSLRNDAEIQFAAEEREPMSDNTQDRLINQDAILSETTAQATASAMSKLAQHTVISDSAASGMTLETMVRDMLKPMLRDWLDQNLPQIVEKTVSREIERLSRRV